MASDRILSIFRKHNINIGCFDGSTIKPWNNTEKNIALYMYKNHFCLIWKTICISFNKAIEMLKLGFKVVAKIISDKHVKSFIKNEYKPKKVQSQLTILVVLDIEIFTTIRAVPYSICIKELIKISRKSRRGLTEREYQKCKIDCIVFKRTKCINKMLDHVLKIKAEAKKKITNLLNIFYTW